MFFPVMERPPTLKKPSEMAARPPLSSSKDYSGSHFHLSSTLLSDSGPTLSEHLPALEREQTKLEQAEGCNHVTLPNCKEQEPPCENGVDLFDERKPFRCTRGPLCTFPIQAN